ncbi:MAG TPA: tyrosine-type recombinase/integrase [Candidatus Sulfotelmatobacter sp.]
MSKRRHQTPKLERHGKFWTVVVRIDDFKDGKPIRSRKRIRLCPLDRSERTALKLRDEYMRPINSSFCGVGSATNFREFVHGTYLPCESAGLAKSTLERYKSVLKLYLLPAFGERMLRELTPAVLQAYFSQFAKSELSHESIDKIRDVLATVLRLAAGKYRLLTENPMQHITLPRQRTGRKKVKPHISPVQFDQLVNTIPEPYATMVYTAIYTGLRVSELIGLKWGDLGHDSITIDERYCRGDWSAPKSNASNATIGVDRCVIERIFRMKLMSVTVSAGLAKRKYQLVKSDGPDDLVFQSVRGGRPMRDNNILTRFIKPAGRKLGFEFVNWRCLRTSRATWMVRAGANVKDIQGQMRHEHVQTTLDLYAQFVSESARRAIDQTRIMADAEIAAGRAALVH